MDHQVTLTLPDEVYRPLLQKAHATGRSVETLAGECLAQVVKPTGRSRHLRRWAGSFSSGVPDSGQRHDDYVGEGLVDELRGKPNA
jgi:hypothetical protein